MVQFFYFGNLMTTMTISTSTTIHDIIITCADGLETALHSELTLFGISADIQATGRLSAKLSLEQIYQICLWSRVASRVLLPLGKKNINPEFDIAEQLYTFAKTIDWTQLFHVEQTFAIRLSLDKRVQANQQFSMLRVKDAIADKFNETLGSRPNVDKNPDFAISVTVNDKQAEIFLDLSGTSLHRRGYRTAMTDAPLKENLASALLYHVGFHENDYDVIIDPMCGSGTLIIEALLMKADYAVGLDKAESQFGFYAWQHHNQQLWENMVENAQQRFHHALEKMQQQMPAIFAFDMDSQAIRATHKNLMSAGLTPIINKITLQQRSLSSLNLAVEKQVNGWQRPLIITNPPYGERLGEEMLIKPLYQGFGKRLQHLFQQSPAHVMVGVLAGKVEQADTLPLLEPKTLRCHNGALTVYFRYGELNKTMEKNLIENFEKKDIQVSEGQDFINRLQKNLGNLKKLAHKQGITNLRIYDADLPDFKVAVDIYGNFVHVQEYTAPKSIAPETAKKRFNLALHGIREALSANREQVFIKTRAKQSGNEQYEKKGNTGKFYPVYEPTAQAQNAYFLVNFSDYLDTGLFLDHRSIRKMIAENARGKTVLNLFAYTCSASVHAVLGGAKSVTSVDLSQNYLDWGRKNFALNGIPELSNFQFIAHDVFEWLKNHTEKYDLIFIDPPTFSNSKKFKGTFDVQRDHSALINRAMNRLNAGGVLYFSNNFSKFILDDSLSQRYQVENITQQTIGFDFDSKKPIHQAWLIYHKS